MSRRNIDSHAFDRSLVREPEIARRAQQLRRARPTWSWRRRLLRRFGRRLAVPLLVGRDPDRQQHVRFEGAPAIADAEIERLAALEQVSISLLVASGKFVDRTGVAAERKEPPFAPIVTGERDAGIILDDG